MDEAVVQSLVKWPAVPTCYGWLALDRRGRWRMRDDYAQTHHLPGDVIEHAALNAFISRNYASDTEGRYFFQNGPQRVYVDLDATPWVVRMLPSSTPDHPWEFQTQCASVLNPRSALLDESGHIYIIGTLKQTFCDTDKSTPNPKAQDSFIEVDRLSVALLHDHDLDLFSGLITLQEATCSIAGEWRWHSNNLALEPILAKEIAKHFDFQTKPKDEALRAGDKN